MNTRIFTVLLIAMFAGASLSLPAAAQTGGSDPAASEKQANSGAQEDFGDRCRIGVPGIDDVAEGACDVGSGAVDAVSGAPGAIAKTVGGGVLDQATQWMTDAATWTTGQIAAGIQRTSTPELEASWYRERFASMAALGLGLAALVALMALGSAALRRDAEALGATVFGMFRAGIGTGLVLVLTVLAVGVADEIANAMAGETMGRSAGRFWNDVGDAWGKDNFAGFGSSAIAFLFAFLQVIAGLLVWIEMLLRSAAIYIAVLFLPAALAASIWPPLREWESRLVKVLFVLIAMKPVVITVLALAGHAAAAALTGKAQGDVGVALAGIVIFALAAVSPWALMTLVSLGAEGAWSARAAHHGAREGLAQAGSKIGGSLGAARSLGGRISGARGSAGAPSGGVSGGRGSGGGGSVGRPPSPGSSRGGGAGSAMGRAGGAPSGSGGAAGPVGTVAAAAGLGAYATGKAAGQRAGQSASQTGGTSGAMPAVGGSGGASTAQRGDAGSAASVGEHAGGPAGGRSTQSGQSGSSRAASKGNESRPTGPASRSGQRSGADGRRSRRQRPDGAGWV